MALPHWLAVLAVFYIVVGVEIVRRVLQPSCRNCLYRHDCPISRCGQYCLPDKHPVSLLSMGWAWMQSVLGSPLLRLSGGRKRYPAWPLL
jgi:hypothetical protein